MKSVQSAALRGDIKDVLDDVQHHGEHYEVLRYYSTAAVLVPPDWYRQVVALKDAVHAFTHDTDGHWLPSESELPVGELLRLLGEETIREMEAGDAV